MWRDKKKGEKPCEIFYWCTKLAEIWKPQELAKSMNCKICSNIKQTNVNSFKYCFMNFFLKSFDKDRKTYIFSYLKKSLLLLKMHSVHYFKLSDNINRSFQLLHCKSVSQNVAIHSVWMKVQYRSLRFSKSISLTWSVTRDKKKWWVRSLQSWFKSKEAQWSDETPT